MPHYAIVFKKEFEPGDHWKQDAPDDDSDRKQHWKKGDLYSVGTVLPDKLPYHFEAIVLDAPPEPGDVWSPERRGFIKWHEDKGRVRDRIAILEAEIAQLQAHVD